MSLKLKTSPLLIPPVSENRGGYLEFIKYLACVVQNPFAHFDFSFVVTLVQFIAHTSFQFREGIARRET